MRNLDRALSPGAAVLDLPFGGHITTPNSQYPRRKIDLCGQHCQGIFQLFHACDSRTHEAALSQNIFRFCTLLFNVSNILLFFPLFPLFLKIARMSFLSRIGPDCPNSFAMLIPDYYYYYYYYFYYYHHHHHTY